MFWRQIFNICYWKGHYLLIAVLCISFLAAGCGTLTGQQGEQQAPGEFISYTIADSTGDWGFPSPWGHYQRGPGYIRMSLIFDTLLWKDEEGFIPALAADWKYDRQEKAYIFTLRDDIYWHDGRKFSAEDVIFTYDYMRNHPYPWVDLQPIHKVEAAGNNEVKFTLKNEYAPFLAHIAATMPIIPKHIWENVSEPRTYREPLALIGTGPFKLADYSQEQGTYLYRANENYYGGEVLVDELRFVKTSSQMTVAALTKGEVDAAAIQPEMVKQLPKEYSVISETGSSNVKLMFNHQKEPLAQKEFRQALAYALNREELTAKAGRGYGLPGNPWFYTPASSWYSPEAEQYEYNPQKAEEILAELGYELVTASKGREKGFWAKDGRLVKLELLCDANLLRAAEVIKEQLALIGLEIDIKSVESQTRDARVLAWEFDLALNSHGGLGGDPNLFAKFVLAEDFNSCRYQKNVELQRLIEKQAEQMDEAERQKTVREIQNKLAEEVPFLTLYYPESYWAHNGRIPLFYTPDGIGIGVPLPLNKLSFLR